MSEKSNPHVLFLVQEEVAIPGDPNESAYVTRAACTSQAKAYDQLSKISRNGVRTVLLKVPVDEVFPAGLPPGAVPSEEHETDRNEVEAGEDDPYDLRVPITADGQDSPLSVSPMAYLRDRLIREAEMMRRMNVQPLQQRHQRRNR